MNVDRLHKRIAAIADVINGVNLGPNESLAGAEIVFKESATQAQKDAANAFLASLTDDDLNVPEYVTRYQFKRAVLDSGQLAALKAAYSSLTDAAKLYWEEADRIGRDSVLITELQAALGLGDTAVDNFFKNASRIQP